MSNLSGAGFVEFFFTISRFFSFLSWKTLDNLVQNEVDDITEDMVEELVDLNEPWWDKFLNNNKKNHLEIEQKYISETHYSTAVIG